ncbi:proton-coupled amino acid transporter-like protein pathetic isoform X2 [Chrysoperla carnea]|uniref:proton-coupled amino acid transporter-like protein pathetic isoform X2 n=1 Tax=Chrysoperla carnea TaxID=189513 RepID=UPI001D05C9AC|nr:proton-coupled amino acid transporter-like protein pathetic isoform X2 [Chrysoperla carnea]
MFNKNQSYTHFDDVIIRKHGISDCETLTHLSKAALGSGILAMGVAFRHSGLALGCAFMILVGLVCTHCAYLLVACAHELYKRKRVSHMTFSEVSVEGFKSGPQWCRMFAEPSRIAIQVLVFITYFGTCSVYTVIVARNIKYVADFYWTEELDIRFYILFLLPFLILLSYIPDYKRLAPVSMLANICVFVGLCITLYYIIGDLKPVSERKMVAEYTNWPSFFSISIFAIETIGVVMPLENNMKTPKHFLGLCGVLNRGMSGLTLLYMIFGFLGYLAYGDETEGSITLNLDKASIPAQIVQVLIGISLFCTFGLQFFVALEIVWDIIKNTKRCSKRPRLYNYTLRTVLVILAVGLAAAVPAISPFIGLIGAFCFSLLGLVLPSIIESVIFSERFGFTDWRTYKNGLIIAFGLFALIFGSKASLEEIVAIYTN